MFWDNIAGVYDIFVKVINRRTHNELKRIVGKYIEPNDNVLECAAGTGMLSAVIAERCNTLVATDFAPKMIKRAEKNCSSYTNITFEYANIMSLKYPDDSFDKVIAGNVIHLLDEPLKAHAELNRVCKPGGLLIIPTYMNRDKQNKKSALTDSVGKAGADFKQYFNVVSYIEFFKTAGYDDVNVELADGRIPCAVATMTKLI